MCAKCDTLEEDLTTQVLLAAATRELILAQTDTGESVPHATRPLSAAEKRAKMRFGEIDKLESAAAEKAAKLLAGNAQVYIMAIIGAIFGTKDAVEPGQVVDAVEQINKAQPADVIAETERSQKAMSQILGQVYAGGAQIVIGEALRQGVKKTPKPFKADAARFEPVAKAVALHPWTRLTSKLQADMLEPRTLAQPSIARADVQKNLEAIPLDGAVDLARQTIHTAHGAGRVEAAETMAPEEIWASELMDGQTCPKCADVDGKDYATMEEAKTEYETGGYGACLGGARCRGTLVFQYNRAGTDAPQAKPAPEPAAPAEPKPPVDPTATPWGRKVIDAKKQLPDDVAKLGYRVETPDAKQLIAEERARVIAQAGGDLPELKKRLGEIETKMADLDAIYDKIGFTSYPPSKWPADLLPIARKLGLSRKSPKNCIEFVRETRQELWNMRLDASSAVSQLERNLADVEEYVMKYKMKDATRKIDDVLPDGNLGDETAKALDAVLDAGKAMDDELQARITRRLADEGFNAKDLATLQARRDAAYEKFMKARPDDAEAAHAAWFKLATEATAMQNRPAVIKSAEAKALIAEVRAVGGGARPTYLRGEGFADEAAQAMEISHNYYPDDWNDHLVNLTPEVKLGINERGYNSAGREVMLSPDRGKANLSGKFGAVAVHEMGHTMELAVPGLKNLEWAFHHMRSDKIRRADGTVELKTPYDLYGGSTGHQELTYSDKWAHDYTGKSYRRPGDAGAEEQWEIFQTGVESLFEGSKYFDRGGSLGDDAEFRRFILGVLSVL
jgi:hypothetical protein